MKTQDTVQQELQKFALRLTCVVQTRLPSSASLDTLHFHALRHLTP